MEAQDPNIMPPASHFKEWNLSMEDQQRAFQVLSNIFDPEIPASIYAIGLIYNVSYDKEYVVKVDMTLTSPSCPESDVLLDRVATNMKEEFGNCFLNLVWEPLWSMDRIPLEVQIDLGLI